MWTYIIRRLLIMIPTLFGVTIISFCVMQYAPGDPLLQKFNAAGGQSSQTREAYLIQKRDLKLDKPVLLNFRFFENYTDDMLIAAYFRAQSENEIAASLPVLADAKSGSENEERLRFLRRIKVPKLKDSLNDPEKHPRLAEAIRKFVQVYCEDIGVYGAGDVFRLLESDELDAKTRAGLIDCLRFMIVEPFVYVYSRDPSESDSSSVIPVWSLWWQREKERMPALDLDRREIIEGQFAQLVAEESATRRFEMLVDEFSFSRSKGDLRVFIEALLDESSSLDQKAMAATVLKNYVSRPLETELPQTTGNDEKESGNLRPSTDPKLLAEAQENWELHYQLNGDEYNPSVGGKMWGIVADTQYAHMVWRLVTFDFGRSATKTKEPVAEKIWNAVLVSAPLMLLSQLVIYFIAIPLGFLCAANRGSFIDRAIQLGLFLLYSIPPFVAAMMFLLFFCYGDYLKLFPMERLHSLGAEEFGFFEYVFDYLWHAFFPVVCLSLFSLAGLAMYARSSMLDVIGQDYIRTARAKGVSRRSVLLKHAARNSLIPILTLFANFLPAMLGGSVLIEYLFNIPGMGRLGWSSILNKDTPTLMALLYIQAILVLVSMLITDILYVIADPRISFESQGKGQ